MRYPLDRADFTAWLDNLEDGTIVGQSGNARCCPITNYVKLANPHLECVATGPDQLIAYNPSYKGDNYWDWDHPLWVRDLIRAVDTKIEQWRDVQAQQLRELLRQIPQEMEVSR